MPLPARGVVHKDPIEKREAYRQTYACFKPGPYLLPWPAPALPSADLLLNGRKAPGAAAAAASADVLTGGGCMVN